MKIVSSQLLGGSLSSSSVLNQSIQKMQVQASMTPGQEVRGVSLSLSREAEFRYQSSLLQGYSSTSKIAQDNTQTVLSENSVLQQMVASSLSGRQALEAAVRVQGSASSPGGAGQLLINGQVAMEFSTQTLYQKQQTMLMTTQGAITTEDGRNIGFSLQLSLEQEVSIESTQTLRINRKTIDPLVLNFGAETARLGDKLFRFDLTGDGDDEHLAVLGRGSGYLVLDRNANGQVDDGRELFGPASGSGFRELSRYDEDGNRWIDENDAIFSRLRLWVDQDDGEGRLVSLAEAGIGAIHLDARASTFDLLGQHGVMLGQLKSTAMMIMEDGEVRTIQEIDLADQKIQEQQLEQELQEQDAAASRFSDILQALGRMDELRVQQAQHYQALRDEFLGMTEAAETESPESIEDDLMERWLEFLRELSEQLLDESLSDKESISARRLNESELIADDELLRDRADFKVEA